MTLCHFSLCLVLAAFQTALAEPPVAPKAFIDGTAPGWRALGEADFVNVNCATNTWTWRNGEVHCTGQPVGVIRMHKPIAEDGLKTV